MVFLWFLFSFSKFSEVLRVAKSFQTGVQREVRCTGSVGYRGAAVSELLSEDRLQFLYRFHSCAGYLDGE